MMELDSLLFCQVDRNPLCFKLLFFSQVALIVAQSRDRKNRLSGILLTSLSQGLQRVAVAAKKMKGNKVASSLNFKARLSTKLLIRK